MGRASPSLSFPAALWRSNQPPAECLHVKAASSSHGHTTVHHAITSGGARSGSTHDVLKRACSRQLSSGNSVSHICQFQAMLMTALSGDRLFTSATRTAVPCSSPDSFCALPSMRSRQLLKRASLMAGSRSSRLQPSRARSGASEWITGACREGLCPMEQPGRQAQPPGPTMGPTMPAGLPLPLPT